jgi:hypothetical protein
MVIIGIMSFPPEQSKEIGKRFLEFPPLPAYMSMKGPFISNEVGVGIKSITIYEFDQSKTLEAIEFISNRYTIFYSVPGYTCSTNTWLEAKEALKMIGLA